MQRRQHAITVMTPQYMNISYHDLLKATSGFSSENVIGTGGFGVVYKGVMAVEGIITSVAIKVLNLEQRGASRSFLSECETLRSVRHRNLIKVLSCCSSIDHRGNDFKAVVFEYMPNGSLEEWLHPKESMNSQPFESLSIMQRLNIAIDVAAALGYLHEHGPVPVVHCDLKPSNILLDNEMVAHVGDFGLARFLIRQANISSPSMTSASGIKGSIGYIPPGIY
jgi:serine/threonine protein kinase